MKITRVIGAVLMLIPLLLVAAFGIASVGLFEFLGVLLVAVIFVGMIIVGANLAFK